MKKKLTNGEKRECRLRYLYRQLIRAGVFAKRTPMKAVRGVLEEKITLQEKKPRKKRISSQPTKKQRRKTRKSLKRKFRTIINLAKKVRRERRKANYDKKREESGILRLLAEKQVRALRSKLHRTTQPDADLSRIPSNFKARKGKGKKVIHEKPN